MTAKPSVVCWPCLTEEQKRAALMPMPDVSINYAPGSPQLITGAPEVLDRVDINKISEQQKSHQNA